MSDDLPARVIELERRIEAADARAEERHRREVRMEQKLDTLVAESERRQGREAAERRGAEHERADRHETGEWLRSFIPTGIWVAFWAAVVWAAEQLGIRPPGGG